MSQLYNHNSGDYQDYLAVRAQEQTQIEIKNAANKQMATTAYCSAHLANKIDEVNRNMGYGLANVNRNLVRMETGIRTSIDRNTFAVVASHELLQNTFQQGFDSLNNTLDLGFAGVSNQIGALSSAITMGFNKLSQQIENMQNEICNRLDEIHDIVNNPLLTQSRELYRRAVANFNKGFYEEALEDIKQAVEKNKTDYISWFLMGKIYAYGVSQFSNTVNIENAASAFLNAAKYITPDISVSDDAKKLASEIYYNHAFMNYVIAIDKIKKNDNTAADYLTKAKNSATQSYNLSPNMLESLYLTARCEELLKNREQALKLASELIEYDGLYTFKFIDDPDFENAKEDIFKMIEEKRQALYQDLSNKFKNYNTYFNDYSFHNTKFANKVRTDLNKALTLKEDLPYLDLLDYKASCSYLSTLFENEAFPTDECVATIKYDGYFGKKYEDSYNCVMPKSVKTGSVSFYTPYPLFNDEKFEKDSNYGYCFDGNELKRIHFSNEEGKNAPLTSTELRSVTAEQKSRYFSEERIAEDSEKYGTPEISKFCTVYGYNYLWELCCGTTERGFNRAYLKAPDIPELDYISLSSIDSFDNTYFIKLNKSTLICIDNGPRRFNNKQGTLRCFKTSIISKKTEEELNKKVEEFSKKCEEIEAEKQEKLEKLENLKEEKKAESKASYHESEKLKKISILYYISIAASLIIGGFAGSGFVFALVLFAVSVLYFLVYYKTLPKLTARNDYLSTGIPMLVNAAGLIISISGIIFHFIHGFFLKLIILIVIGIIVFKFYSKIDEKFNDARNAHKKEMKKAEEELKK